MRAFPHASFLFFNPAKKNHLEKDIRVSNLVSHLPYPSFNHKKKLFIFVLWYRAEEKKIKKDTSLKRRRTREVKRKKRGRKKENEKGSLQIIWFSW